MQENAPDAFTGRDRKNVEIIRDIVGIRPAREGGVRVEKEVLDGQNVVHAYGEPFPQYCLLLPVGNLLLTWTGTGGGGYVFSFGVARAAGTLVNDFLFSPPTAKL